VWDSGDLLERLTALLIVSNEASSTTTIWKIE